MTLGAVLLAWEIVPRVVTYYLTPNHPIPFTDFRLVTLAEYNQLATGMSYEQACKVLDGKGVELSRNEIGDIVTVMYAWQNPDGSNMNAMFQDGGLIQKAQFGLR